MELAHSLLLNEDALQRISENKRPVFIFEWLRFLDKVLVAAQKSDIKESQAKLIVQLTNQISGNPGPPTRKLLARCLATIFSVGDTFALFETINKCNDILKSKDDSPSYLPTRLAAISCIGGMYEKLGRMVGRSYEETVSILIKALKNAESQGRCEIMLTLQKAVAGLGSAGSNCYKDIYKAARNCMTDRSMTCRSAAAKCLYELVLEAPFLYTSDLDTVISTCFRALDGSNYDVRCDVAKFMGHVTATALNPPKAHMQAIAKAKKVNLEDILNLLSTGFIKGGTGFLKTSTAGEMIKGGGSINREVRVGVTHAYVEFGKCMGGIWLERNLPEFVSHIFGLVSNPRTAPSHVDAVYARRCVLFILRSLIGGILSEKAQVTAAKEICQVIVKQMNIVDGGTETDSKSQSPEAAMSQHVLVCALHELGCLIQSLGTSASSLVSEPSAGIIEPVASVLIHPSPAARLSAAWCLRSVGVALPSQMTILIERCTNRMHHLKSSAEAVSGYTFALAALLGGVSDISLGIPHAKGKQIFNIAEELLKTATQNSRLSQQRTQSGWLLLGALMTLGTSVVKQHLPRMMLLWRNAFPRTVKDLEAEKSRGDAFTWQVSLEARAGALAAMQSFIQHNPELITEDVTNRLLPPLECALTMCAHLPVVGKMYGAHLKAPSAMVRMRLYGVLTLLPPGTYEGSFNALLRELVAEFTLTDNPANTTTSLLRSLCHADDSVILGSWLQETDHKAIEDQLEPLRRRDSQHLQPNSASGSGALEHDAASLYLRVQSDTVPGPLPLGVAVIDSSVKLFGLVFPRVANKHRLQMLEHFTDCIKSAKSSRQQAVQINIFTAVLCGLKALADTKSGFGSLDVRKAAVQLVMGALSSSNPILRCAGGEALGRMAQVVGDSRFIAEMAQFSFDRLKSARDVVTRTGHSLALGCLHRYVGGMGSGQHLNTSVSILLALAQDQTSPVVQVWALHALALVADCGGPMFRGYVEPSLSLVLQLLLSVPPSNVDVHQCLGKCLAALITTVGPELQGNSGQVTTARLSCLVCCAIMQDHYDALVQAEAISCLQQLHLFAPRHVNLTTLVPHLCETLHSPHLLLRRAAVSCLRQLSTREAREISDHALTLASEGRETRERLGLFEVTGLEGALFAMLDKESDRKLCSDVQDTLISVLQALASEHLTRWLALIKDVLQATSESSTLNSPAEDPDAANKEDDGDEVGLAVKQPEQEGKLPLVASRWPTKVFAIQCLLKIVASCEGNEAHFDLSLARELKGMSKGDYLVLHLSELVRMAFIAATSDSDKLRLAGLDALDMIIDKYAKVPEPEFPGHVILEQYQAQVGAALRPAFTPDTAPDVTAKACEVCSCWIGSGVARDLNDLRRVHQLLVSSLSKLKEGKDSSPLYSESASTMEKLAVLRAWAEVYIVAMDQGRLQPQKVSRVQKEEDEFGEFSSAGENLLNLVQPEMKTLSRHWLAALKDYALISLPTDFLHQLPPEGGTFYTSDTMDSARPYYRKCWPPILYAVTLWLVETGFTCADKEDNRPANMKADESDVSRCHLLLGICMEALCSPTSVQPLETVTLCLRSVYTLTNDPWPRRQLGSNPALCIELVNILHRLLLTRESKECFSLILEILKQVVLARTEQLEEEKLQDIDIEPEEQPPANAEHQGSPPPSPPKKHVFGEGGESGFMEPGKSVVYACLEVCLCVLVRHLPALNPAIPQTGFQPLTKECGFTPDVNTLISSCVTVIGQLFNLCSPKGTVGMLPTALFLLTGIIKEMAPAGVSRVPHPVGTALSTLKTICMSQSARLPEVSPDWKNLLQSALSTLIQDRKPDHENDRAGIEESTLLLTLSVFIVSCPVPVVHCPTVTEKCIDIFKESWESSQPQVKVKVIQSLISLFQHPSREVCTPYIHALATPVVEYLLTHICPEDELQLAVVYEGIKMVEVLVALAEEEFRVQLVELLVPLLVSHLLEPSTSFKCVPAQRALHEHSLSKLTRIGPQYPAQFRTVMQASPDLRQRLESAVKAQQAGTNEATKSAKSAKTSAPQPAQPSIRLKMDFSNFKS